VKFFCTLALAACSTVAAGQNSADQGVDRVIYLTSIEKTQEIQEVATVIRSVADIRSISTDASQRSLSVRGTAEQVALAESLAQELMAGQRSNAYDTGCQPATWSTFTTYLIARVSVTFRASPSRSGQSPTFGGHSRTMRRELSWCEVYPTKWR
jgi:hypothetical protein